MPKIGTRECAAELAKAPGLEGKRWRRTRKFEMGNITYRTFETDDELPTSALVAVIPEGRIIVVCTNTPAISQDPRPWDPRDIDYDEDEDRAFALWDRVRSNEFLFAVGSSDEGIMVAVTPAAYWIKERCQYDRHTGLDRLMPEGADEVMESTFLMSGRTDPNAVRLDLMMRGFVDSHAFSKFISAPDGR
jgi:hypothetical protein